MSNARFLQLLHLCGKMSMLYAECYSLTKGLIMAKKNFYAVKKGKTPGIYETWDECKKQVDGFPGAEYKGFALLDEAREYLGIKPDNGLSEAADTDIPQPQPGCAIAYVDGSFNQADDRFSYGVVLFVNLDGKVTEQHISKAFNEPELAQMRNVAGEIMGSGEAMKRARAMGLKQITIYHDYEGIAKWCLGEWKTNKTWTQKYKTFYDEISQYVHVDFVKVKGHSGDKYNDLADSLAKEALGIIYERSEY